MRSCLESSASAAAQPSEMRSGESRPSQPPAAVAAPSHASAQPLEEAPLNPADLPLLSEFTEEARSHLETAETELLKLEDTPDNLEAVNAIFRAFHTIKGVAGFLNLRQIGALAHAAESLLDLVRKNQRAVDQQLVDVILQSIDMMKLLVAAGELAGKANTAIGHQPELPALLERLQRAATWPADNAVPQSPASSTAVPAATDHAAPTGDSSPTASTRRVGESTIKVSTSRLDSLINMVGELVIAQAMVNQDMATLSAGNHRLVRHVTQTGKIVRELQDLAMSMRMVPIGGLFQKMTRLVRDLAHKLGKQIDLEISGAETELDRNVVDAIGDPLVHMVRNAADHGIEPPDLRIAAGKPATGMIRLHARHEAGCIVIEIANDGRGLSKERILRKAIANGIVQPSQELSDAEIYKLIFHAGLSTAEKISDVSGRGVGMDVVRKNIEALRGRIDITTTEGQGSVFTIRLPLTLAVIDGLVARVGKNRYILPTTSIEQSIRPTPDQLSTVQQRGEMVTVRGSVLPLFRLHRLFGVNPASEDPTQGLVVIVRDNARRACLLVNELLGQQQVVIKSLGDGIGRVTGVSGGAILGDGTVSLILDIPGLLELAAGRAGDQP